MVTLSAEHPFWLIISAVAGATVGYMVYNTGVVFGLFKTSQLGLLGCLQSLGTIGCGDTVNGFIYNILGGIMIGVAIWAVRFKVGAYVKPKRRG